MQSSLRCFQLYSCLSLEEMEKPTLRGSSTSHLSNISPSPGPKKGTTRQEGSSSFEQKQSYWMELETEAALGLAGLGQSP